MYKSGHIQQYIKINNHHIINDEILCINSYFEMYDIDIEC